MPTKLTTANWCAWMQDARKLALNQAVDLVAAVEFLEAQQERIDSLERAVRDAQAQGKVWRELAAERGEQLKTVSARNTDKSKENHHD
jgi:hypothetical protein